MTKYSHTSPAARRTLSASALVALTATLLSVGSCQNPSPEENDGISSGASSGEPVALSGIAGSSNGGASGNGADTSGSSPAGTGTDGTSTAPGAGTSGAGTSGAGTSNTGASSGGTAGGMGGGSGTNSSVNPDDPSGADNGGDGAGPAMEPCEDVEPPPDPEWPEANCERWATETTSCEEPWFADYCDVSCGRCVPAGGSMSTMPEPEPCEDVEPPPDPEWPEATCELWATETTSCEEGWFSEYCDVSCGRCVPAGGSTSNEPEPEPPCEDVEPPEDPEWPGATCAEWSSETTACSEDWFSNYCDVSCGRCIPEGGLPEEPSAPDCSGEGLPNVTGGEGFATRYWDCCQTHCSQFGGQRCGQDGVSNTGDSNSACNGGGSFACYHEAPYAVTECLSYGHIAKSNPNCGGCYRIQFTGQGEHNANDPGSKLIAGKQMIVKVSNTGGDVAGNQFDLMVPGGGVGMFNACSRQWGVDDLGAQYGGFLTECSGSHEAKKDCVRQECMKIPEGSARDGCLWFVDWFQVADNPKFTSQQTDCPF